MIVVVNLVATLVAMIAVIMTACHMLFIFLVDMVRVTRLLDMMFQLVVAIVFAQEIIVSFTMNTLSTNIHPSTPILLVFRHTTNGWMYAVSSSWLSNCIR
jgi:hypothetical protein